MSRPARVRTTALALVRRSGTSGPYVDLATLARDADIHPELARRFVALGLIEPASGTAAAPLFSRDAAATIARAARLRRDLGVGYSGAVLACELLARIDVLERRLRRYEPYPDNRPS
jgi:chaperone modulatory protein CbpM